MNPILDSLGLSISLLSYPFLIYTLVTVTVTLGNWRKKKEILFILLHGVVLLNLLLTCILRVFLPLEIVVRFFSISQPILLFSISFYGWRILFKVPPSPFILRKKFSDN